MISDESPKGNMVYSDEKVGSKSAKLTISCLHDKGAIKKGDKLIIKNSKSSARDRDACAIARMLMRVGMHPNHIHKPRPDFTYRANTEMYIPNSLMS